MALLFLFPVNETGFLLDVAMLFSTERYTSRMDGYIWGLYAFLLNI